MACPYREFTHDAMVQYHGATQEELARGLLPYKSRGTVKHTTHAKHYNWDTFVREARQMGRACKLPPVRYLQKTRCALP